MSQRHLGDGPDETLHNHSHPSLESDGTGHSRISIAKDDSSPGSQAPRRVNGLLDPMGFRKRPRLFWLIGGFILILLVSGGLLLGLLLRHTHVRPQVQAQDDNINLTVNLGYSSYIGVDDEEVGVSKWLGIRYAAPPVDDLRFRAPMDPQTDAVTYVADKHAPLCHSTPSTSLNSNASEDCLFLDVYAPSSKPGLHPVFVFIQGGGLNQLANPNLDGSKLVTAGDFDIVVVTFNYRVGPFGFLASKEIRENGDLNAGLLDQRKVFQWIQKYIVQFGGDPNHVTLGGSSAGAGSVALHLTAYGGRDDGLFHAAAAGSPSFGAKLTVEDSQYQYDTLAERLNCSATADSLQCLRNLDIETFAKHNQNIPTAGGAGGSPVFTYTNVIDGNLTTSNTYSLFTQGNFIKVPIIFGDDTDEGTIFTPATTDNVTQMNSFLKDNIPNLDNSQLDIIDGYYPKDDQFPHRGEYWSAAANAYGEIRYICPGIHISSQYSKYNLTQNWNFRWDVLEHKNSLSGLGVTHTADLSSIWGTALPPEEALIPTIQSYWTSFIRSYNPNTYKLDEAPLWEPFNADSMQRLHFVDASKISMEGVDALQKERCAWIEGQSQKLRM